LKTVDIFRARQSLALSLELYSNKLQQINPASFKLLNPDQQAALENELLFMFYCFSAQYQLDEAEHRRQGLKPISDQIKKCAQLIYDLRGASQVNTPETQHIRKIVDSEKHCKYLGFTVGAFIADKMLEVASAKTATTKQWMGEVNGRRLYWVWGGGLLASVIALLPDDFANSEQAQQALSVPSPLTGYMSWVLYYTRFAINLSLLLKHTIAGPWMSKEERKIPAWERFKTQWQQRKFSLLNDSIWATSNLVCFFWLTGAGMAGFWGNALTAALLLMDVTLSIWKFCEESTQHNKDMLRYSEDIDSLQEKIVEAGSPEKETLQRELEILQKNQKLAEFNWTYKKYGLVNDLVYAVGLLSAFCVVCCFFFPPAAVLPATALILGAVGAALCFILTISYAAVNGALEIAKTRGTVNMSKEDQALLSARFNQCDNEFIKKQLFLDIKQASRTIAHQEQVIHFQKMQLVRAVLVNVLIPPVVLASILFMPLGMGVAVLAAGFAIALISNMILNSFEPKAQELPGFDEREYEEFARESQIMVRNGLSPGVQMHQRSPGFFASTTGNTGAADGYENDCNTHPLLEDPAL